MNFIALFIISILGTASLLSALKKGCECKWHKALYWLVAMLCSVMFALGLYLCDDCNMGRWAVVVYTLAVYGLQYAVSQEVLDTVLKNFLNKLGK